MGEVIFCFRVEWTFWEHWDGGVSLLSSEQSEGGEVDEIKFTYDRFDKCGETSKSSIHE